MFGIFSKHRHKLRARHSQFSLSDFKSTLRYFLAQPHEENKTKLIEAAASVATLVYTLANKKRVGKVVDSDDWMPILDDMTQILQLNAIQLSEEKYNALFLVLDKVSGSASLSRVAHVLAVTLRDLKKEHFLLPQEDAIYSDIYMMGELAHRIEKDGCLTQAGEMRKIVSELKSKTEAFLAQPPQDRKSKFSAYQNEISAVIQKGVGSELLKNYADWQTSLANLFAAVSLLGLVYLYATSNKRGSFWLEADHHPLKKLQQLKALIQTCTIQETASQESKHSPA